MANLHFSHLISNPAVASACRLRSPTKLLRPSGVASTTHVSSAQANCVKTSLSMACHRPCCCHCSCHGSRQSCRTELNNIGAALQPCRRPAAALIGSVCRPSCLNAICARRPSRTYASANGYGTPLIHHGSEDGCMADRFVRSGESHLKHISLEAPLSGKGSNSCNFVRTPRTWTVALAWRLR